MLSSVSLVLVMLMFAVSVCVVVSFVGIHRANPLSNENTSAGSGHNCVGCFPTRTLRERDSLAGQKLRIQSIQYVCARVLPSLTSVHVPVMNKDGEVRDRRGKEPEA